MADKVKPMTKPGRPDDFGDCQCGIPGCKGHEPDADGKIHIHHPNGKHYVLNMSKHLAN